MSNIIESNTMEEAYLEASKKLNCSIVELDIEIVQHPSNGILGMFKKKAIISISKKCEKPISKKTITKNKSIETVNQENIQKITEGIEKLIKSSCYDIELKKVEKYNENTVAIFLDGEDAALMIGKEGYRYKAFSYLLYNWANIKYDVNIRLEIAEFLQNQKEMIKKYLEHVIQKIKNNGRAQTKVLDGILVKIALEELREEFPDKYVGIRTAKNGGKYVLVNDFNNKKTEE